MGLDPNFMEVLNGTVAFITLWVLFFFGRYIWMEWSDNRRRLVGAAAIFVAFAGQTILRSTVWIQRHFENNGNPFDWNVLVPILAFGSLVLLIGSAMIIKVFAPEGTGTKFAAVAILSSLGAALLFSAI